MHPPLYENEDVEPGDYFSDDMIDDLMRTGGFEADPPTYQDAATGEKLFVDPSVHTLVKYCGEEKGRNARAYLGGDSSDYLYVKGRQIAYIREEQDGEAWYFGSFGGVAITDFFGTDSFVSKSLMDHYHKELVEQLRDPEHNSDVILANIQLLYRVGGAAAIEPYKEWFAEMADHPRIGLGIGQGISGNLAEATRMIGLAPAQVSEKGISWEFTKDEISNMFHHSSEFVEDLLGGDFHKHESDYTQGLKLNDIMDGVPDSFFEAIKPKLVNRQIVLSGESGDKATLITRDIASQVTREQIELWLTEQSEYDPEDQLDDIKNAIWDGYRWCATSAEESAYNKSMQNAVLDYYGARSFTFNAEDSIVISTIPWKRLYELWTETARDISSVDELLLNDVDLSLPDSSNWDWGQDKDYTEEAFGQHAHDVEAYPYPEVPGQQQLALESLLMEGFDYATTQINLPTNLADFVIDWARTNVPDSAIYSDPEDNTLGRETEMHVTVLYGITDPKGNRALHKLSDKYAPFPIFLGALSLFTNNPKYDVLKLDVESPWLRKLHDELKASVPNENKYPEYQPHCTLAYVKKGSCAKMDGTDPFARADMERTFIARALEFKGPGEKEDADRVQDSILFTKPAPKEPSPVAEAMPFDGTPFPTDSSNTRKFLRKARKHEGPRPVCS